MFNRLRSILWIASSSGSPSVKTSRQSFILTRTSSWLNIRFEFRFMRTTIMTRNVTKCTPNINRKNNQVYLNIFTNIRGTIRSSLQIICLLFGRLCTRPWFSLLNDFRIRIINLVLIWVKWALSFPKQCRSLVLRLIYTDLKESSFRVSLRWSTSTRLGISKTWATSR